MEMQDERIFFRQFFFSLTFPKFVSFLPCLSSLSLSILFFFFDVMYAVCRCVCMCSGSTGALLLVQMLPTRCDDDVAFIFVGIWMLTVRTTTRVNRDMNESKKHEHRMHFENGYYWQVWLNKEHNNNSRTYVSTCTLIYSSMESAYISNNKHIPSHTTKWNI